MFGLGVNSTGFIIQMDRSFVKDIKKQLGDLIDHNNSSAYRVDCGLQTTQKI